MNTRTLASNEHLTESNQNKMDSTWERNLKHVCIYCQRAKVKTISLNTKTPIHAKSNNSIFFKLSTLYDVSIIYDGVAAVFILKPNGPPQQVAVNTGFTVLDISMGGKKRN